MPHITNLIVDWSKDNLLAVALKDTVYLWNASSGSIKRLAQTDDDDNIVTSVSFTADGSYVSIGTTLAEVQIWDVEAGRQVRSMSGHMARVSALSWNSHLVSSGGRDSLIINHDIRVARHTVSLMEHHTQARTLPSSFLQRLFPPFFPVILLTLTSRRSVGCVGRPMGASWLRVAMTIC